MIARFRKWLSRLIWKPKWHHVVLVVDNGKFRFWVDGVAGGTTAGPTEKWEAEWWVKP